MQTISENKKVTFAPPLADPEVMATLRKIVGEKGRQLQALEDEVLRDYILVRMLVYLP